MLILGLLLIVIGLLAILAALFVSEGSGEILGITMATPTVFVVGAVAGAVVMLGFAIIKWGTKRGLERRRERKELNKLSEKLDRAEADRHGDSTDESDGSTSAS